MSYFDLLNVISTFGKGLVALNSFVDNFRILTQEELRNESEKKNIP